MKKNVLDKAAHVIRVVTIPPVLALVMLLLLRGELGTRGFICAVCFLCVLPPLAYPVWLLVPPLKKRGRDAQRSLAVVFSVVGYVAGVVVCLAVGGGRAELMVFLTYLFSGLLIALSSFIFKVKSSGHAAGAAGPVAMLVYRLGPWFLCGALLVLAVFWSSLRMKRHTLSQLLLGGAFPIVVLLALSAIL